MNTTKIDWADMTWNPVTGCFHNCPYCYAKKIAERFGGPYSESRLPKVLHNPEKYSKHWDTEEGKLRIAPYPFYFTPTFHRYKLNEPVKIKQPQNIFVCSMADLFGAWVPDEWIEEVFKACEKAPQHRYLFLTKNPKRYEQFQREMPVNMWFGHTSTGGNKEKGAVYVHKSWNRFVSIEPMLEPIHYFNTDNTDWVIIGAETGNRKGKVIPKREWIDSLVNECITKDVPVFIKNSLAAIWGEPLIQKYPWSKEVANVY